MSYTKYLVQAPVQGTPISSSQFGTRVRDAISDLDDRVGLLEEDQQAIIARGRRTTAKVVAAASAGTEFGFLRVDNIPVKAGRAYRVMTSNVNMDTDNQPTSVSTTTNGFTAMDVADGRLRYAFATTTGTVATTASTQFCHVRQALPNATQSNVVPISGFYFATQDGFLSILLSGQRVNGTGSLQIFASSTEICDLTIEYAGPSPADTGVQL